MPSFDIVSRVDAQEIDSAVNNTHKALSQRYDFRGATLDLEHDRKANAVKVLTDDQMKMRAVRETLIGAAMKRGIDPKAIDFPEESEDAAGGKKRVTVTIRQGIDQALAKDVVKRIKDSKLKVQASIQGDEVRVTGKKLDDLQSVIALPRDAEDIKVPLQFVNMRD